MERENGFKAKNETERQAEEKKTVDHVTGQFQDGAGGQRERQETKTRLRKRFRRESAKEKASKGRKIVAGISNEASKRAITEKNGRIPKRGLDAGRKWKESQKDVKERSRRRKGREKAFRNRSIIETARKRCLPSVFGRKRTVERLRGDKRSSRGVRTEPDDARFARNGRFSTSSERGPDAK